MSDGDKCIQGETGNVIATVGVCGGAAAGDDKRAGRTSLGRLLKPRLTDDEGLTE